MFRIPDHEQSLLVFGDCTAPRLSAECLRVLVWNVWKGKRGDAWRNDLMKLVADRDLILLQEAVTDAAMSALFEESKGGHQWHMAASFEWRGTHKTGVATGCTAKATQSRYLRGAERELFLWTPKISLGTQYLIGQGREILVINTHVVNFTTTASFVRFVEELIGLIEDHEGPLLLAGDFNTWSAKRWRSLLGLLHRLGVEFVPFDEDRRSFKLDHVFVRGLEPIRAKVRHDIRSSDHYPLLVDFRIA